MNILVLGGGGREHALAWKIKQSPLCTRLICAPGNGGIASIAETASLNIEDGAELVRYSRDQSIDFVVIGPEAPLAAGVADALSEAGVACFGPSAAAAQLEASKSFTKEICDACGAPTAAWAAFDDAAAARAYVEEQGAPIVVKADGLAAGKGVVVAMSLEDALAATDAALSEPGARVVIEEFMTGEEASFFVLTDGETVLPLASAQDHKRAFDGDNGPNTGGMGAYSPAPVFTPAVEQKAMATIVQPVIDEMAKRGAPYRGVLYVGLMIENEEPRLVEFNARFGDPECQILMLRLASDIVPALQACGAGGLNDITLDWAAEPAMTVVLAAEGYPGGYQKGQLIGGLDAAGAVPGVTVFHAGTRSIDGGVVSNGGRVLNVCATAADLATARDRAYAAVDAIDWPGGFHRTDIGWRAL
ncbi:MAG: phosphoribosylamine--glycine ligase [Pseudomonadota bacterium]